MGRGSRGVVGAVALVVVGGGCFGDNSATLTVPTVLAVGAYGAVDFRDACAGSKADLCSNESVQRIESITVEPAGMMEIIPVERVPAELQQVARYDTAYVAHGLVAGAGRVCLQGLFSDGSHRRSCVPAAVVEIGKVVTALSCGAIVGGVAPQGLVAAGMPLPFRAELRAIDDTPLGGDILHPVDDAAFTQTGPESYVWSAPATGGSVTFGSRLDPGFSQTLSTYAPGDVTAIHPAIGLAPSPLVLGRGQAMDFQVAVDVGGRRACVPTEISVRTETPDVCTSDQGAVTWAAGAGSTEAWFRTVSEGTCHLTFSIPGGASDLGALEVSYYLVSGADDLARDHTAGEPCGTAGLHACARDRSSVLVCQSKRWVQGAACGPGICDYTPPAAACPNTSGCAACR
ncbi:MAG: hypothetical protein ACJ8F1_12935 [Polyangia bacterium]